MDEKYYRRYESFCRSLDALSEAKNRDMTDSFIMSGTGAKFGITFDLSWKVMKDIIIQHYMVIDFPKGSPREVLKRAYEFELISDEEWITMLIERNELSHDYDESSLKEICQHILDKYIGLFYDFKRAVEGLEE